MTTRADVVAFVLDRIAAAVDDGVSVVEHFDASSETTINRTQIYLSDIRGEVVWPHAGTTTANLVFVDDFVDLEAHVVVVEEGVTPGEARARCADLLYRVVAAVLGRSPDPTDWRAEGLVGPPEPGELTGPDLVPQVGGGGVAAVGTFAFRQQVRISLDAEEVANG